MARRRDEPVYYTDENLSHAQDAREAWPNVGPMERWLSGAAGLALVTFGIRGRSRWPLVVLGAGLLARAVTGRSKVNELLGRAPAQQGRSVTLASVHAGKGIRIEHVVRIDRPASELFTYFRNFENLPRVMHHLESVINVGENRSHWIARGPAGLRVEWDAELLNEEQDRRIAWRSLPESDFHHAGSVHFVPQGDDRTEVRVILSYEPPLGKVGATVMKLLGPKPEKTISRDMTEFKRLAESGELTRFDGRREGVS